MREQAYIFRLSAHLLAEMLAVLRIGFRQLGFTSIAELYQAVAGGRIRFQRVTEATKVESGLHGYLGQITAKWVRLRLFFVFTV